MWKSHVYCWGKKKKTVLSDYLIHYATALPSGHCWVCRQPQEHNASRLWKENDRKNPTKPHTALTARWCFELSLLSKLYNFSIAFIFFFFLILFTKLEPFAISTYRIFQSSYTFWRIQKYHSTFSTKSPSPVRSRANQRGRFRTTAAA